MTALCPSCHSPLPDFPLEAIKTALTPQQAMIADIVARRPGIRRGAVADFIYADCPNGGATDDSGVSVQIVNANKRLAGLGWKILGQHGQQGYRFERLAEVTP